MTKYTGFQEWVTAGVPLRVLGKDEQHILLKQLGIPTLDFISMPLTDLASSIIARRFLENNDGVVGVSLPQRLGLKKHAIVSPKNFEALTEFTRNIQPQNEYRFLLTQMVRGVQDGYIGTAISNGKGSVLLELFVKPFWTDIRELTSGETDPSLVRAYWTDDGQELLTPKDLDHEELREVSRWLAPHKGYFEFIKGRKNGELGAWFIEAQPSDEMANIFEQPHRAVLEARALANALK